MGFYLRKSVRVGPIRFNLSKSGIGVSAGIPGFRIGAGPRGNYIHMGRKGIYYRRTLPSLADGKASPFSDVASGSQSLLEEPTAPTHDPLAEIDSADVVALVDSSSTELLAELNGKRRKLSLRSTALVLSGVGLFLALVSSFSSQMLVAVLGIGIVGVLAGHWADQLRKTTVLLYDLEDSIETAYQRLHTAATGLASCRGVWHIAASGQVRDKKYHAGADTLVDRKPTSISFSSPPFMKTNIDTIAIEVGRQTVHFFPDRILVHAPNGVGAVAYTALALEVAVSRFIEDQGVPSDAQVVDYTWRYVNKRGGPDRRFKDNPRLPICAYQSISLRSATGLNELIQLSRTDVAEEFAQAVEHLASCVQAIE